MADIQTLGIAVDSRPVERGKRALDDLAKSAGSAESATKRMSSEISGAGSAFDKMSKALNLFKAGLAAFGVQKFFSSLLNEQSQLERNMLRTNALLRANGYAAGLTARQLREHAQSLALNTLQSVEGIEQAQQILLTFLNVTGDTFTRATELAADLATVTGTGLSGAMTMLGKALNDPIQGITAMTRAGVSFSEQQKDQIKRLVESNKILDAQTLILDELARQYGGTAKEEAKGFAGAVDTLGQRFQETKIALANLMGLGDRFGSILIWLSDRMHEFNTAVNDGNDAMVALSQVDLGILNGPLKILATIGQAISTGFQQAGKAIGGIAAQLVALGQLDLRGAMFIGEAMILDIRELAREFETNVGRIWGTVPLVKQAVDEIEGQAKKPRTPVFEGVTDEMKQMDNAYKSLSNSIKERIALHQVEAAGFNDLTDGQTTAFKIMSQLRDGTLQLTNSQKQKVTALLEELLVIEKSNIQRKESLELEMKYAANVREMLGPIQERARAAQLEVQNFGKSQIQIERAALSRIKEAKAIAISNGLIPQHIRFLEREIEAREDLIKSLTELEVLEKNQAVANDFARAWEEARNRIDTAFADMWKGAFKSFSDFGASLRNAFRQLLAEMAHMAVTRPILVQLGAMGTMGGASGIASASTGGSSGGIGNLLQQGASSQLGGMIGSGLVSAGGALGGMTGSFLSGAGTAMASGAGFMGSMSAATSLMATGTGAGVAAGAGMMLAAAAPYLAAVIAIASMFNKEKTPHSGAVAISGPNGTFSPTAFGQVQGAFPAQGGAPFGESDFFKRRSQSMADAITPVAQMAAGMLNNVIGGGGITVGMGFSADGDSKSRGRLLVTDAAGNELARIVGKFSKDAKQGFEEFSTAAAGQLRNVLVRANLEGWVNEFIVGLGDRVTMEQLSNALGYVQQIQQVAKQLNGPLQLTAENVHRLSGLFGGVDQFLNAANRYYQQFFSEQERLNITTNQLRGEFAALGLALPATRDQFRALVQAQNLSTEAGRKTYATLLQLSDSFAFITEEAFRLQEAMAAEQDRILNERFQLETRLLQLQGDTAALRVRELNATHESNRELLRRIFALEDEKAAMQALTAVSRGVVQEINRLRGGDAVTSVAGAEAQFAMLTAMARAGDLEALGKLPELSRIIEQGAMVTAGSVADMARVQGRLAASLETTLGMLGVDLPGFAGGGTHGGGWRIVGENGPELEATGPSRIYSNSQTREMLSNRDLLQEVRQLREEVKAANFAIVKHTQSTAKQLQRWDIDGIPEEREPTT